MWAPVNSSQKLIPPAFLFPESVRVVLYVDSRCRTIDLSNPQGIWDAPAFLYDFLLILAAIWK